MTNTRERGLRHQYLAAAAVVCPSSDPAKPVSWHEQGILSWAGFPP